MIGLIGIDVDGTLVGSSGVVAPSVWEAAARARAAGIHLAICSGRPAFGTALDYARHLDPAGWHIFQNGASIVNLGSGQTLSTALPPERVIGFIEHARSTGDVLELYSDARYVAESDARWAFEHADLLGVAFEPQPFETLTEPVVRAQWLLPPERAKLVMSQPHDGLEVAQSTSPLMPGVCFVGMTLEGVSKGSAIRTIAAAGGIPLEQVMYVGDSGNDLPALRLVGCPVAMGNANDAVKSAAARTVGHVDDGGLADAIEWAIGLRGS